MNEEALNSKSDDGFDLRGLSLKEATACEPIASGYQTDRIYRLARTDDSTGLAWTLHDEQLEKPLTKNYDDGSLADWLSMYTEAAGPDSFRFTGAFRKGELVGLATWSVTSWNRSTWLADIRVRADIRRQGAGTRLLEDVQKQARYAGSRGVRVETQTTNYTAVNFYLRHGFRISGFDDHLYTNNDLQSREVALFLFWELG